LFCIYFEFSFSPPKSQSRVNYSAGGKYLLHLCVGNLRQNYPSLPPRAPPASPPFYPEAPARSWPFFLAGDNRWNPPEKKKKWFPCPVCCFTGFSAEETGFEPVPLQNTGPIINPATMGNICGPWAPLWTLNLWPSMRRNLELGKTYVLHA